MQLPAGVFAILATPFDASEELDLASLRKLVEWEIEAGVKGLVPLGIFGEFHRLLEVERDQVIAAVVEQAAGRVPVVVGISHGSAKGSTALARRAEQLGATAVMAAPPPQTPQGKPLMDFYRRVAEAVSLPIVLQDEPAFTGVQQSPEVIAAIAAEVSSICCVKLEEAPTPPKIGAIKKVAPNLPLYGGNGGVFFLEELARGASGTMTGVAVPAVLVEVQRAWELGDKTGARKVFERYLPMIRYENQPGIALALRKESLVQQGVIASATVRHPARGIDDDTRAELRSFLEQLDLV